MYSLILQALITIFGILAIYLLSLKHKVRRYGFISGLVSDVFWVLWVLLTHNYIFLIFTAVRILCYLNGIRNYFLKKPNFLRRKTDIYKKKLVVVKEVQEGGGPVFGVEIYDGEKFK